MTTRRADLCRRSVSLLLAALFVAFVVQQAPHLVHHFFEPEHVQDECPFAASAERAGALQADAVVVAIWDVKESAPPTSILSTPTVAPAASRGRAPPAPVS